MQTRSRSKVENKKEQELAELDAQSEVQETPMDLNLDTESSQPPTDTEAEVLNTTKEALSDIVKETDDSESQGHACKKSRSEKREERPKFNLLQNARIGIDEHKTQLKQQQQDDPTLKRIRNAILGGNSEFAAKDGLI